VKDLQFAEPATADPSVASSLRMTRDPANPL
jgi:hypothetical protein